jgi:putative MATE family efflux protein
MRSEYVNIWLIQILNNKKLIMITLDRLQRIFLLSLPIIGGMISQNVLNIVDVAMVGHLGATALAAVGAGSFAAFVSSAMVLGLSSGVQAVASRRLGEKKLEQAGVSLYAGVIIAFLFGSLLTLLIYPYIPTLFPYLNSDVEVAELGSSYWQIRVLATVFMGVNYAFRGYFNGISQPKYYMVSLVFIHVLNIILNYILIFGHLGFDAMGADGAAWASTISVCVGSVLYFVMGFFKFESLQLFRNKPSLSDLSSVFKLTLPSGFQQLLIAIGMVSLFWMVGKIGVSETAALNILINILMLCILPGFGFGMAAATLVGTSLGERDKAKAKQWAYDVAKIGGLITFILGLVLAFYAEPILKLFTDDQATIEAACLPLQITGAVIFLDVVGVILMNALLGSGDVNVVLKTSMLGQWAIFFPVGLIAVIFYEPSLLFIWLLFSFSRLGQGVIYGFYWHRERWGSAKI